MRAFERRVPLGPVADVLHMQYGLIDSPPSRLLSVLKIWSNLAERFEEEQHGT